MNLRFFFSENDAFVTCLFVCVSGWVDRYGCVCTKVINAKEKNEKLKEKRRNSKRIEEENSEIKF